MIGRNKIYNKGNIVLLYSNNSINSIDNRNLLFILNKSYNK